MLFISCTVTVYLLFSDYTFVPEYNRFNTFEKPLDEENEVSGALQVKPLSVSSAGNIFNLSSDAESKLIFVQLELENCFRCLFILKIRFCRSSVLRKLDCYLYRKQRGGSHRVASLSTVPSQADWAYECVARCTNF